MAYVLDEGLRPYATDKQWEKLQALAEHGSERAAAAALGIDKANFHAAKSSVLARAARHGYAPDHDMRHSVPDGFRIKGTSTLYDAQTGEAKVQWVKSEVDRERQAELFREAVAAFSSEIVSVAPLAGPEHASDSLMALYPVGDHHLGMLSWDEETGANYDLSIGERLLMGAAAHLVNVTPACERALVAFMGDYLHYDSFESVTPTSRNQLDSDSRFPKMVRVAIRSMRHLIETAAKRHKSVRVIVEIGNHDLSSSIFLMECLANIYADNPRISVDTSPQHFHYYEFGKNLIGTHHGHGKKMQDLPLLMAVDRPEEWGRTTHRVILTGHVHHDQVRDFPGCTVESLAILPPVDAWAAQKGYRSKRCMKAMVYHAEFGEVARHTVNPDMLG